MRRIRTFCFGVLVGFFLLTGSAPARAATAPERESIRRQATPAASRRDLSPAEASAAVRLEHQRHERRLARKPAPGLPRFGRFGEVAVIEDDGSIVTPSIPRNLSDLVPRVAIELRPLSGGGWDVRFGEPGPAFLNPPQLFDITQPDDSAEIVLPFAFPYQGATYDHIWVHGGGYLTLGAPGDDPFDPNGLRDAARFLAGPPRIAPLYSDLFPTLVIYEPGPDDALVTWLVTWFDQTVFAEVRARLGRDGTVRFEYPDSALPGAAPAAIGDAVIGVSPGGGGGPLADTNFVGSLPAVFPPGAVYEEFSATISLFDLPASTLHFQPTAGGFAVSSGAPLYETDLGPTLALGNGQAVEVALPFAFPFLGGAQESVFISDDGTLGFGRRCSANSLSFLLATPPCVAAFGANLRPDLGGSVHARVEADRVVVTWAAVPAPALFPNPGPVTTQAVLHADGRIEITYPAAIPPTGTVVVGVTAGGAARPQHLVDLSSDLPLSLDAGSIVEVFGVRRFEHVDLADRSLTFIPAPGGFAVSRGVGGWIDTDFRDGLLPVGGCSPDGCPETFEVSLGFSFPFLGGTYDRVYVNDSGNVTFGGPDTDDVTAASLIAGPPRITVFGFPADESDQSFAVRAAVTPERAVITWDPVITPGGWLSMQLILEKNGTMRLVHAATPITGLIGVAAGGGAGPVHEIDFSADLPATLSAGVIFEEFTFGRFATVDFVALAREFYRTRPDNYDFLVVFTDFPANIGAVAFNAGVSNRTLGLGLPVYDDTSFFGSAGELESLVAMNNIELYWPDAERLVNPPIVYFQGVRLRIMGLTDGGPLSPGPAGQQWTLGIESPISVMAEEAGHRWMAYARLDHPMTGVGPESLDLLGRSLGHWSHYFHTAVPPGQFAGDPRSSAMEGNVLRDLGPGPLADPRTGDIVCTDPGQHGFLTDPLELEDGYSALDQYLMGLRKPSDVGPLFYVDHAFSPLFPFEDPDRFFDARANNFFCGQRVDFSIADILAHPDMGPRLPASSDENDDGLGNDVKTMAFVLLTTRQRLSAWQDDARRVDTFRRTWQSYANGPATGGRGRFDTRLDPPVH